MMNFTRKPIASPPIADPVPVASQVAAPTAKPSWLLSGEQRKAAMAEATVASSFARRCLSNGVKRLSSVPSALAIDAQEARAIRLKRILRMVAGCQSPWLSATPERNTACPILQCPF